MKISLLKSLALTYSTLSAIYMSVFLYSKLYMAAFLFGLYCLGMLRFVSIKKLNILFFYISPLLILGLIQYLNENSNTNVTPSMMQVLNYSTLLYATSLIVLHFVHLLKKIKTIESELKLKQTENIAYKASLDQTAIVAFTDRFGIITKVNEKFCELSGYASHELIGQNHRILNSGYHPKEFFSNMWKTASSGNIWRGEVCNKNKSGQLYWLDSSIVALFDEKGKISGYCSVRFHITQKKSAEEQLLQSSKMNALGEMAASIAHEINTPLSINLLLVENILEVIKKEPINIKQLTQIAHKITTTTMRISKIVKSLKSYSSSSENYIMEPEKLSDILEDITSLSNQKLKISGITLKISQFSETIILDCQKVPLEQVLLNFINNSIDAVENLKEKWITIDIESNSTTVKFIITDSGSGIPEEIAKNIFKSFYTTKPTGKGTGLGLAISMNVIKSHHGSIRLDQTCPNTRFIIELPLKKEIEMKNTAA